MDDNANIQCLSIAPGIKNLLNDVDYLQLNPLQITAKGRLLSC